MNALVDMFMIQQTMEENHLRIYQIAGDAQNVEHIRTNLIDYFLQN